MKIKLSSIALALSLAYASSAAIASDNNAVFTSQQQQHNMTYVQQIDTSQSNVVVNQNGWANGVGNTETLEGGIVQQQSVGASARVDQTGNGNYTNLVQTQAGFSNVIVTQQGDVNDAQLSQSNTVRSSIEVRQVGGSNANVARVAQQGADSSALIVQDNGSLGTFGEITQSGAGNHAEMTQRAASFLSARGDTYVKLIQDGSNNTARAFQTGQGSTAVISQSGTGNYADTAQTGYGDIGIDQTGSANVVFVRQNLSGSDLDKQNLAYVTQNGTANNTTIQQDGFANHVRVVQR